MTSTERILLAQGSLLQSTLGPALLSSFHALPRTAGLNSLCKIHPSSTAPPILLLHGYGSGLGFFFRNLGPLSEHRSVYAVDWLGLGGSDRPKDAPKKSIFECRTSLQAPQRAVDFFTESLKTWADFHLPSPAVVVGHSLGGYLAARFALRHPGHVSKLVLASPAGLSSVDDRPRRNGGRAMNLVDALWSANVTPMHLVRILGEVRGRNMMREAVKARFGGHKVDWPHQVVADYLFEVTRAPASGEFALNALLRPPVTAGGIVARVPLEALPPPRVPVLTLYGDRDWLLSPAAAKVAQSFGALAIIPGSGHHLYLDQAPAFNAHVAQF